MFASMIAGALLGAAPQQATPPQRAACPTPPITAAQPGKAPGVRKLNEEPPPRHIATVHAMRDGCPVMLVRENGGQRWVPAPGGRVVVRR